jgi:RNase adapter protein RapZ
MDTGELNTNQLRSRILDAFAAEEGASSMRTSVVSFGYKYGLPLDVDLVFDCRFLPNPFWIGELRPYSGLDAPVRDYVLGQPETKDFLEKVDGLLKGILPSFEREGKSYLTIALGCTGGRHRSVALAEALAARLGDASVFHRDVDR